MNAFAVNLGLLTSVLILAGVIAGEFRQRVIGLGTVWVRPAILAALTVALAALSVRLAPQLAPTLGAYLVAGISLGILAGVLVARSTAISSAGNFNTIQVRGSAATIAIWAMLLAGRLAVRFANPSQPPIVGLDCSVAAAAVVATAFAVLAIAFQNAIHAQRVRA